MSHSLGRAAGPLYLTGSTAMEIARAIKEKRLITFRYQGNLRTVEPHTYGFHTNGHEALCAYQVQGASQSGAHSGWKTFRIAGISSIVVSSDRFLSARPGYKHDDGAFKTILAQL